MEKLPDDVTRLHMIVPTELLKKVEVWRRKQLENPNRSEAIRQLLRLACGCAMTASTNDVCFYVGKGRNGLQKLGSEIRHDKLFWRT